jgi:hypothetical protein
VLDGCADHAKGCRFHHFQDLRSMPPLRLVGNIGLTFLTKLACGYWNVLDPVNGFFACRADVLRRIPLQGLSRGYFFETDLLIRLNIVQARVIDVALPARYGSQASSLSPARSLLMFPARLATGLLRRLFWRYLFYDVSPVAIFALLGGALASFGGVFGAYHWVKNSWAGVATPLGTIMVATLPLIVGIQLMLEAVVLDVQNTPRPDRREGAPISRR